MTTTTPPVPLSHRERSVLRAVHDGRCLVSGRDAALLIDGIGCCDQFLGPHLVRAGLIAAPGPATTPAQLTASGRALLTAA